VPGGGGSPPEPGSACRETSSAVRPIPVLSSRLALFALQSTARAAPGNRVHALVGFRFFPRHAPHGSSGEPPPPGVPSRVPSRQHTRATDRPLGGAPDSGALQPACAIRAPADRTRGAGESGARARRFPVLSAARSARLVRRATSAPCAAPCAVPAAHAGVQVVALSAAPVLISSVSAWDGGYSSVVERRTVAPKVAGSNPVTHPNLRFPPHQRLLLGKLRLTSQPSLRYALTTPARGATAGKRAPRRLSVHSRSTFAIRSTAFWRPSAWPRSCQSCRPTAHFARTESSGSGNGFALPSRPTRQSRTASRCSKPVVNPASRHFGAQPASGPGSMSTTFPRSTSDAEDRREAPAAAPPRTRRRPRRAIAPRPFSAHLVSSEVRRP
jgi:hypothetical protein